MPKGIPVATFAIGEAGAANAGLFAVALIAATDPAVAKKLAAFRLKQTADRARDARAARREQVGIVSPLIAPGAWLGLLGGGQLGRMFCMAAQSLGYKVVVLDPGAASPAGSVADRHVRADYQDPGRAARAREPGSPPRRRPNSRTSRRRRSITSRDRCA